MEDLCRNCYHQIISPKTRCSKERIPNEAIVLRCQNQAPIKPNSQLRDYQEEECEETVYGR